jgi:hypothetical protein
MGAMQAIMSGVVMIFFYGMVVAAVWKLFEVAKDLREIKTLLLEIRRTPPAPKPVEPAAPAPAGPISLASAEALLREVEAESHSLAADRPKAW